MTWSVSVNRNLKTVSLIFADNLLLISSAENYLQYSLYNLNIIAKKYNMEINTGRPSGENNLSLVKYV